MFRKGLTRRKFCCFIVIDESCSHPQVPRQARRHSPLHHRDPSRLVAPSHHPSFHRLFRLRRRQGPPRLGFDRQLSGRPHQADQPSLRTDTPGPPVAAQLPEAEGQPGAHLRIEPCSTATGEETMSRMCDPQFSFADLELRSQGVQLDPTLRGIAEFLDRHPALIEEVRLDLVRGLQQPTTGRNGITPSQTLRALILMRAKNWDYRELRERINDGYTLRGFTDFDSHRVPQHDAFNRAFNRLTPKTLEAVNQAVIQAAIELGVEDGKKLRVDTTVVETNIHYPTDATLLWDSVRTITRLVEELHRKLPQGVEGFTNRTQSARRRMQALERMSARERHEQQQPKYRELIRITEQVVHHARHAVETAKAASGIDVVAGVVIDLLQKEIASFCDLADRVIDQTRRRVIDGEQVPT